MGGFGCVGKLIRREKKVPIRVWIGLMVFLTTYVNYTMRSNMSIAIVSMVTAQKGRVFPECKEREMEATRLPGLTTTMQSNDTNITITTTERPELPNYGPRYDWDQYTQSAILGSYFYGYIFSSLPGGIIAERYGPFAVLFWTHLISAVFNSACEFAAWVHYSLLMFCRIVLGLMAGLCYPALQCLIARWAPPSEKGKFVSCLMGNTLGTCITWPLVGAVTQAVGWGWGFHVISAQVLVYCVIFYFVAANSPEDHKWITEEEKNYIKESQGGNVSKKRATPPYKKMFTSMPFWILNILHFGNLWGLYLQITNAPKYIAEVVGFNLRDSGGLAAMPHLTRMFMGLAYGNIGDFCKKKGLPTKFIRKFFVIFSHIIPGILLIGIPFVECQPTIVVALLITSMGVNGAAVLTNLQNPQDLAPNFAGSIFGIISFIGGTTGFIVPAITGAFINHGNTIANWTWAWVIGGCMYISSGLIFILFGSTKQQEWNKKKEDDDA
ncbi:unnamed protein product [Acanthoscelides obtectus]|uniref:Major facilitator superfamily (MFS) profile domain-containing protein n=1 Tax=Acanthoscelides obtectus TaxID=200917 RepID=A0A9P0MEL6_ACAOB|nr:unnamed protein product [Acanthoscelides obtectus]CAK1636014.1 Sialin [Acanthoscelides obtectus]